MAESKQVGKTWECKCPQTYTIHILWCPRCGASQPKAKKEA